jgi:hypothetical protein
MIELDETLLLMALWLGLLKNGLGARQSHSERDQSLNPIFFHDINQTAKHPPILTVEDPY